MWACGIAVSVRGSAGVGVCYAALPGTPPPGQKVRDHAERISTVLSALRTTLLGRNGSCTVLTAPRSNAILPGITRGLILQLAERARVAVREQMLTRDSLGHVTELFLTGTTSEVLPIVRVDGRQVGDGKPGPVTRRLQEAYAEAVREFVARPLSE